MNIRRIFLVFLFILLQQTFYIEENVKLIVEAQTVLGSKAPERPYNSCTNYFEFTITGTNTEGQIRLRDKIFDPVVNLILEAIVSSNPNSKNVGSITLINSKDTVTQDIYNGRPLLYRVKFPPSNFIPQVTVIYINKEILCAGPSRNGVKIRLTHRLETGVRLDDFNQNQDQNFVNQQSFNDFPFFSQNFFTQPPIQRVTNPPTTTVPPSTTNSICGSPISTLSLIKGGTALTKGDFPWMAALHYRNIFICGGSLISMRHVITAAHCVQDKRAQPIVSANTYFVLGGYNLRYREDTQVHAAVSRFILHPDWRPFDDKYDADISIAVLSDTIRFNRHIIPICLPDDFSQGLVGQQGTVTGWGKTDGQKDSTDVPRKIVVPIVSDVACLRSHPSFVYITSQRTFCAGGEGDGPCNGDSGGGLMVKNWRTNKWELRGIVSVSLKGDDGYCDVNHYIVFTDVAQFYSWIRQNTDIY